MSTKVQRLRQYAASLRDSGLLAEAIGVEEVLQDYTTTQVLTSNQKQALKLLEIAENQALENNEAGLGSQISFLRMKTLEILGATK